MNLPRYARVLLAIGSGAALGLAFPNYNFYLLAWVAMGLLVLASAGAPLKEAPLYGFLHGQVFYPVCLPWVDTVMRQYGNIDPWISAAFVGMIGFIGGLICMAFSTGVALASRKSKLLACALAPFLWPVLGSVRLSSRAQPGAAANHLRHRNLRPLFPDRRFRVAGGPRRVSEDARRLELRSDCNDSAALRHAGRPAPDSHRISALHRTSSANQFPAVRKLSPRLAASPRRRVRPARTHQRGRRARNSRDHHLARGPRSIFIPGAALRRARPAHRPNFRKLFPRRRGGLETKSGREVARIQQRSPVESARPAHFRLRQNPSATLWRIRSPARLAHFREKTHRRHFRFHSRLHIRRRASPPRKIRHLHLLRSHIPQRSPPVHRQRRATPRHHLERRLVRPLLRPRTAHGHGARPLRRKPPLAPARHQQRLHRIDRPLRPHRRPTTAGHPRPVRRPLRFPQRPNPVCPLRRLV